MSPQRKIEELNAERERILRFRGFVTRLAACQQLADLGEAMLDDLCRFADASGAALFVIDTRGGTDQLWLASTKGLDRDRLPAVVQPGEGPTGEAALERRVIRSSHELHLPMVGGQELHGVAFLTREGREPFEDAVVEELESLRQPAATALATALSLRAVEDAAELNRAVLDSVHDAYIATDRNRVVETWSAQAASLYGYTAEEAVGQRLDELLVAEDSCAAYRWRHKRVLTQGADGTAPERFEVWTTAKDGRRLLAELTIALARREPRPLVTHFARDVTERWEAERLKSEFFALVSHELRTPLTSVIGYLEIVRDGEAGDLDPEQRRYVDVIYRNAERLLRLVGDLLFAAQVDAGGLLLERGPVDLASVVTGSIEAARPRADVNGVALEAELEPLTMQGGDADRLGQLIDNLVSNALKFTPKGGTVTLRLQRIGSNRGLIEVADTGDGISAEDQKHLFERFYRAPAATQGGVPGIGLGLSICKVIAEGLGGSIGVQSEEGEGTTFRVELPLGS